MTRPSIGWAPSSGNSDPLTRAPNTRSGNEIPVTLNVHPECSASRSNDVRLRSQSAKSGCELLVSEPAAPLRPFRNAIRRSGSR
jgi:hypothetical protein